MSKLIQALQILLKYGDSKYPTHCEHDVLMISDISPSDVSITDKDKLNELGFIISEECGEERFVSYEFGSA